MKTHEKNRDEIVKDRAKLILDELPGQLLKEKGAKELF